MENSTSGSKNIAYITLRTIMPTLEQIKIFGLNLKKSTRIYNTAASCMLLLSVGLIGCASDSDTQDSQQGSNAKMVEYFADNGTGNPLAVVQHPAGEYHDGITYVSYQGPLEDPYVAAYNHKTKKWLGPFRAGTSDLGRLPDRNKFDNHGKPTLLIDNEGYIHIFYGGHGGSKKYGNNPLGNIFRGANKHSISKKPLDISSWEEVDNITPFGTYNQAIKMDNGDIYLFFRHGAHRSDWVYQKSTDKGRTFGAPVSFLKHKRRDDLQAVDSWYAWVGPGQGDEIIVSYDYHLCWDMDATSRGHTTERHNAYYMVFNTKTGAWRNIQGESLTVPVTREQAEEKTLVWDTGKQWTFNGSAHLDKKGHPHIATNIGKDLGTKTGGPKLAHHIKWDGNRWVGGNAVNGQTTGNSRGDFLVTSPDTIRYILADKDDKDGIVAWWESVDGGNSFNKTKELLRRPNASFAVTTLIKNAHSDALMLVAEKSKSSPHRKIYLIGEYGPVKRALNDARLEKDKSTFRK